MVNIVCDTNQWLDFAQTHALYADFKAYRLVPTELNMLEIMSGPKILHEPKVALSAVWYIAQHTHAAIKILPHHYILYIHKKGQKKWHILKEIGQNSLGDINPQADFKNTLFEALKEERETAALEDANTYNHNLKILKALPDVTIETIQQIVLNFLNSRTKESYGRTAPLSRIQFYVKIVSAFLKRKLDQLDYGAKVRPNDILDMEHMLYVGPKSVFLTEDKIWLSLAQEDPTIAHQIVNRARLLKEYSPDN